MVRQIQRIEEKYKDRFPVSFESHNASQEMHLFAGGASRGNLCICPALETWISAQLKDEAAVATERRKAREERQFDQPKKKCGKGNNEEGG